MDFELTFNIILIIALAGFVAGFVDAISGGGGLVSIPILLSVGLPPVKAIATEQVQSVLGLVASISYFTKNKLIKFHTVFYVPFVGFIGGILGAYFTTILNPTLLRVIISILFFLIVIYILISPAISDESTIRRLPHVKFAFFILPLIAFYDGFLGIASGLLAVIAFSFFLGYRANKSTANAKLINASSNLSAVTYFIYAHKVVWSLAIVMGIMSIIGNIVGTKLVIKKGASIIRPFLIVVSVLVIFIEVYSILK